MITNKGKDIIAKYLIGQAPAYASYIAIGCGAKPLNTATEFDDYSSNTELNFEMFRVPIISRGYVNEEGTSKIVFTAELPTEERYQISEVGVYSAAANPSATGNDSRVIFSFSNRENWEQHGSSSVTAIKRYDENLNKQLPDPDADDMIDTAAAEDVFQTISNNPFFTLTARANRNENCRFLNNTILLKGTQSNLTKSTIDGKVRLTAGSGSKHIHLNAIGINLEKNAPNDLMKIAFSVVGKNPDTASPDEVRIMVEFAHDDAATQYARFDAIVTGGSTYSNNPGDESFVYPSGTVNFSDNRYYVVSRELQELQKSTGFSWGKVAIVKIYATVIKGTALVSNKSATSTVVTLTTSVNHSFIVGDKIIVSGLGDSERFDGTFEITEVTSNTIKYNKAGATVSSTAVSPTVQIVSPSKDHFVCLDAIRLDNVATENPLYGLTGYSPVKSPNATPILKDTNTKNFVEFRFAMGIDSGIVTS